MRNFYKFRIELGFGNIQSSKNSPSDLHWTSSLSRSPFSGTPLHQFVLSVLQELQGINAFVGEEYELNRMWELGSVSCVVTCYRFNLFLILYFSYHTPAEAFVCFCCLVIYT